MRGRGNAAFRAALRRGGRGSGVMQATLRRISGQRSLGAGGG